MQMAEEAPILWGPKGATVRSKVRVTRRSRFSEAALALLLVQLRVRYLPYLHGPAARTSSSSRLRLRTRSTFLFGFPSIRKSSQSVGRPDWQAGVGIFGIEEVNLA